VRYPSVEHAFHAGKAILTGDAATAAKFATGEAFGRLSPFEARRQGRRAIDMTAAHLAEWDAHAADARMRLAIEARLRCDRAFKEALLATGNAILVHCVRSFVDVRLSRILTELRHALH